MVDMESTNPCVSLWNRDRTLGSPLDYLGIDMSSWAPTGQTYFKKQHPGIVERYQLGKPRDLSSDVEFST